MKKKYFILFLFLSFSHCTTVSQTEVKQATSPKLEIDRVLTMKKQNDDLFIVSNATVVGEKSNPTVNIFQIDDTGSIKDSFQIEQRVNDLLEMEAVSFVLTDNFYTHNIKEQHNTLHKYDPSTKKTLWSKDFKQIKYPQINCLIRTLPDKNVLYVANELIKKESRINALIKKINTEGEILKEVTIEGQETALPQDVFVLPDGSVLLLNETTLFEKDKDAIQIVKLNEDLGEVWKKNIESIYAPQLVQLKNNILMFGTDRINNVQKILLLSNEGDVVWEKQYSKWKICDVRAFEGNFVVLNLTQNNENTWDVGVVTLDQSGKILREQKLQQKVDAKIPPLFIEFKDELSVAICKKRQYSKLSLIELLPVESLLQEWK